MKVAAGYLLDTNVISETRKIRADGAVIAFLAGAPASALFISVLTLGELRKGVEAKRRIDPMAAEPLAEWVDEIETNFADRVLPINATIATCWGKLSAGRSLPVIDTLVAAMALTHALTLVTRNTKDVEATGAMILDPWKTA